VNSLHEVLDDHLDYQKNERKSPKFLKGLNSNNNIDEFSNINEDVTEE